MQNTSEEITIQSVDYIAGLSERLAKEHGFVAPKRGHFILPKDNKEFRLLMSKYSEELSRLEAATCYNKATQNHLIYVLDTLWHQTRWYAIDELGL